MSHSPQTSTEARRRTIVSVAAVTAALYLPFAWLLELNFMTNNDHMHWLCMGLLLPGFLAGIPLKSSFDDTGLYVGSSIFTGILFIGLVYIGARYRSGVWFSVVVGLFVSIPTSILSYWLFRH